MKVSNNLKKFIQDNKDLIDAADIDIFKNIDRKLTPKETIQLVDLLEKAKIDIEIPDYIRFIRKVIGRTAIFVGIDDDNEDTADFQNPLLGRKVEIIDLDVFDGYDEDQVDQENFEDNSYWILKFLDTGEEIGEIPGIALKLDKPL